jgi:hypothetical protein
MEEGLTRWEANEDQFKREVAPGKNRVLYLLGHLTAVNDAMLTSRWPERRLDATKLAQCQS